MTRYILSLSLLLSFVSCSERKGASPLLATVVKLNSAESLGDFDEAINYIDVDKVYSKYIEDGTSPDQAWREYVMFTYELGHNNKFTNTFKYYQYNIRENQYGDTGDVIFESISSKSKIKKIVYNLKKTDNKWKVIDIEYTK